MKIISRRKTGQNAALLQKNNRKQQRTESDDFTYLTKRLAASFQCQRMNVGIYGERINNA